LTTLIGETLQAFRNSNFRWYFSGAIMLYMLVGIDTALGLYVNTYIWQLSGLSLLWVSMGSFVGYLIGAMLTRVLHKRFEKKQVLMVGTAWFAVFQLLPIPLWFFGWLPAEGSVALVLALTATRVVQGIGVIQFRTSGSSMLADVADEYEMQTGKRQEGVFFGAQMVTYKATSGLGKFFSGIFLAMIAWPTTEIIASEGIAHDQLVWLALLYGPCVSIFAVFSLWCYSRYRLNAAAHQRIRVALAAREASPRELDAKIKRRPAVAVLSNASVPTR
jgi:glycoside/pentoside/hexuronide:cation symporter, GPH family